MSRAKLTPKQKEQSLLRKKEWRRQYKKTEKCKASRALARQRWRKKYTEKQREQTRLARRAARRRDPIKAQLRLKALRFKFEINSRKKQRIQYRVRARKELRRSYVRQFFKGLKDVPKELLELKALHLKIKRNLKDKRIK